MDHIRARFLALCITHQYVTLPADETVQLHKELDNYLKLGDPKLSEVDFMSLCEMLFYLKVLVNDDIEAEVVYRRISDRLGENSPKMHVMKATLLQITEGDLKAVTYLKRLRDEVLEFDTDSADYLFIEKKILAIERATLSQEVYIGKMLSLLEKFPLDGELWWALASEYSSIGQFDKAAYCLEEVIVIAPFAYNVFAKLGEVLYYSATCGKKLNKVVLQEALDNCLRAVELSETCLKAWSFIAVISDKLKKRELSDLSCRKLKEIELTGNPQDIETARFILDSLRGTVGKKSVV
ncbi:HHR225Cp [Eremothecium sinecaudum]|uniref:ER membrane protein complex subunit 2 n=1 Tax=Eremothecium sinecaudum TaxID=45286 RepID=A0A0X8HWV3_9SACH|nr:HHR225Cp [Eremothecium sinecaudum]AMD22994.1 HHR225Cp [Eremothecium sinecaudum]